ncbi:hypothetical protein VR7878_03325 [Vibrio ruber DSM 16370]|uniref:Uncharacterized protein n=1 Tax=Vibrio ruber (strain DSM 16370 / JCM 11486 / BCRC 17186 / CECT 7878 / LMG 23124 / VR1) TaxID=1123498 RepID=A0A1R4LSA3_VIBR1|nr:hypothetical protein VRK_10800 [Vibrio sp. MEBiC08052]SJN59269.1 hypothetical protein VR7878_03325 [Vibrio ruber DSM 16370]
MGCCNTPPPGGSKNIGLFLKYIGVLFAVIVFITLVFG